ncbi:hypothetical protein BDM02DRAFT_3122401 [Thelephora ganbajun]|uniref:Uncharacterized protein n=1 Tax=Thelephora ganbajun TaxID=370292 RepID=A0ACB6Z3M5_THEGA|nr:hypothetical protein BDM02DRAFT_3122401 [Thelephora ganbajun]
MSSVHLESRNAYVTQALEGPSAGMCENKVYRPEHPQPGSIDDVLYVGDDTITTAVTMFSICSTARRNVPSRSHARNGDDPRHLLHSELDPGPALDDRRSQWDQHLEDVLRTACALSPDLTKCSPTHGFPLVDPSFFPFQRSVYIQSRTMNVHLP